MNTAKTLEEYISLNLSENYQFIDEGDGYCDIMLCNIYDVTKNQYEKLIDLLSQQEIITPIYRIKFSYDISDYEYFYENNNDPNYICLTIYYDDEIKKCPNHVLVDAEEIAKQCGNTRGANIVLVGAALPFLDMPVETVENAIRYIFSRKGEQVVEANLAAMRAGYDHSMKHKQ